jgi:AraC-like DNA-binding protein
VLSELAPLLEELGVDAHNVLASTGLDSLPRSPEVRLPFAAMLKMLENAAAITGCPHLGLMLGQRFNLAHHGVVGEIMRCAHTFGRALADFTSWQQGYSSGAVVYLLPIGESHALGYGATGMGNRVLYDAIMVIGLRMIDQITGGAVKPEEVHFAHRQPPDKAVYARHIHVPIRFNEQRVCILVPSSALETHLPCANHLRHQALQAELRRRFSGIRPEITLRTRHAMRILMQRGMPSMQAVADELSMHPRTLRRHLAREQTSFENLCAALRYDMARELLDLTDLPMSEISATLAYASPNVFAEAFRRWSGLSPTAFRRRLSAAGRQGGPKEVARSS